MSPFQLRCREDIKKPRPQDAAEEAKALEPEARSLPLIFPRSLARQELAPYLNRSWEQRRGCQDFSGPEPSVLLDEHNVKVQIDRAFDAGHFSEANHRDGIRSVQILMNNYDELTIARSVMQEIQNEHFGPLAFRHKVPYVRQNFRKSRTDMVHSTSHYSSSRMARLRSTGYGGTHLEKSSSIKGIDRIISGAALLVALISVLTLSLILG